MPHNDKGKIRLLDFTMIMVSFVIGMGIFRTPVNAAQNIPSPSLFFLAWALGGFAALCGALTYAEIGSRYPATGGYFRVFSFAYHPSLAFGVNCIILVSNASSLGAVALVGAEYISPVLFPAGTDRKSVEIAIAVFCIVLFYGVNMLGLVLSAKAQTVLMLIKIALVALLVLPAFFAGAHPGPPVVPTAAHLSAFEALKGFGIGLVAVFFTYGGYQQTINFGEEVHNPSRTIPRAIVSGIFIIVALYLAVNFAYVKVIGYENLKSATNISAIMAEKIFGNMAGKIMSVLLFLGVLAYVNGSLLSNPRVMAAMGEDGVLPKLFSKRTAGKNVLMYSLTVFALIAVFVVFYAEQFDRILNFTIFLDCIGMALSAGALFKIRKQTRHLDGTGIYQMKWFPAQTVIFIASYSFIAISIFLAKPGVALLGLGILTAFIAVYFLFYHRGRNRVAGR